MRKFSATPLEMFACIWRNRQLIMISTKREVVGRYRGSFLGLLWSFIIPLFMLAVYTFVFSEVFKARWNGGGDSKSEFALVLFVGLMMYNLFSECINRAPGLVVQNPNFVKKVVYPLEILPFVSIMSALYHVTVSFVVWMIAYYALFGWPHSTVLFLPLILIPYILFILGMSWVLASLGVFVRDLHQVIGVLTNVLMFLSPIFYPASAFPVAYQKYLDLNPLTKVIEMTRDVLYWGVLPAKDALTCYWLVAIVSAWVGFASFQKTRKEFADAL